MIFLHRNPSSKTLATLPARNGSANDGCLVLFGERPLEWGRKSGANTRQMLQKTTRFFICRLKFWIDVLILHGRHSQTLLVNHFHQTNEFGIVNFELALGTKVFRDFDQSYQWSLGNEIQAVHASQACHWNDWDDVLRCAKKVFTVRSLHDSSGERLELKFSRFPPHPRRFRVLHLSTYALPRVRGFPSPLLCRQLDEHLDSGRKHQKIKLNELQVQCRLWNCVKKEGFCKVNTDQRISKNHIFSSFGFVVMSTLGQATFQCFCEEHSWSTLLSKALCRQFLDLLVCCYLDSPKQCLGNRKFRGFWNSMGFYWCENMWKKSSLVLFCHFFC